MSRFRIGNKWTQNINTGERDIVVDSQSGM